jgi:thiol-disulfide isomerase/thioredoxin
VQKRSGSQRRRIIVINNILMKKFKIILFRTEQIFLLLTFVAIFFAISCDKINEPYLKDDVSIWNGRKIVIYDFTGHKCGNCPRAHEALAMLQEKYPNAIIPIGIHCTDFAKVTNSDTNLPFHYDFRTDIGDYLGGRGSSGYYGDLALPMGLVNNLSINKITAHNQWATVVASHISSYPEYLIEIIPEYRPSDSIISVNINTITHIGNAKKIALVVFLLEDNIVEWQRDYSANPQDIKNYVHKHVLRAGFNSAFGEIIKNNSNNTTNGDNIRKNYQIHSKSDWTLENLSVVAFVYNCESMEILQAETVKIVNSTN